MSTLTFDDWNRDTTRRICAEEDPQTARNVRAARGDGLARFTLWDDYLEACQEQGVEPESQEAQ